MSLAIKDKMYGLMSEGLHNVTITNVQWFSGLRYKIGTTEREEEWFLTPKRHQIKHLEFVISWFGTRGSEVQNPLSPTNSFS